MAQTRMRLVNVTLRAKRKGPRHEAEGPLMVKPCYIFGTVTALCWKGVPTPVPNGQALLAQKS